MRQQLIEAAKAALRRAYAPYSGYKVGAAVLSAGKIYSGVNVENASYGLSMCAERAAVLAAVSDGARSVEAVAIAVEKGVPSPCGACRQVLREFGENMDVLLVTGDGTVRDTTLAHLLPDSFGPSFLREGRRDT
ncbi:MAG: Cytidine deaminase [Firmicutes bacterium]|nr:Cytidine deaminase [candidate division NPL-UPA2 bacterium]MBT9153963.1 Cytidine deaminase [candidate division NPL-UPA2 bacterium]MBT9155220.1 Cytidine deaminase [candidate division NPL-UPA2 bacterium]